MPKYLIRTVSSYINEYEVTAENCRKATEEGLKLARNDHPNAEEVDRSYFVIRTDLDPQVVVKENADGTEEPHANP